MERKIRQFLEHKAYKMRLNSLIMTSLAGSGHPTSALSAADIVAALFFYAMAYDPENFENPDNDRFILSKGHAAPLLYTAWKEAGVISQDELFNYRKIDSNLEGHPTRRFAYSEAATGSLGIGLSIGTGMALAAKLDKRDYKTYVLLGDAELSEGSIWEAAEIAAHYKLNNLIGIVDDNRLGQSTESLHGHHTQRYADKFNAFGWHTFIIDGHNMQQLMMVFEKACEIKDRPTMIIAKTYKGHGVELFENMSGWHGKVLSKEDLNKALAQLDERFKQAAAYHESSYTWQPKLPRQEKETLISCDSAELPDPNYPKGQEIATRQAYGQAITKLGAVCKSVVCLDAEVKNSTFAEIFEAQFPERFFQCFVAEQNMVSMGVGFDRRGHIPFISTFGAFFSRAYDQIRMAAIGSARLRLCGSHAGVSIGQDGPSQMALEDIALMRAIPASIVLYPSDAVSTHKLVGLMARYDGISYLRTTRMATPTLYDNGEQFVLGGCKILRNSESDVACVIAAGITLHEALKAYDRLRDEGIFIAVIDLYSIKPVDEETIKKSGNAAGKKIITVEDHYLDGGLGQAVAYAVRSTDVRVECLAVKELPRSGKPDELLALMGIDAAAIIRAVIKMMKS